MISSSCKYPDEAFDLISRFSQGEGLSEPCRQQGNIPMNKEVLETAEWIKEYPWFQAAADLLLSDKTVFYDGYVWLPNRKPGQQAPIKGSVRSSMTKCCGY